MADAQAKLAKHMGTDTVANCYRCHFPSTWGAVADEPAQSVIAAGKGAGTAQNCENCHTAKGVYLRHGLTDDAGADGAADVHDKLPGESGTATSTVATVIQRRQQLIVSSSIRPRTVQVPATV